MIMYIKNRSEYIILSQVHVCDLDLRSSADYLSYSYEPRSKFNHISVSPINRGCLKYKPNAKV